MGGIEEAWDQAEFNQVDHEGEEVAMKKEATPRPWKLEDLDHYGDCMEQSDDGACGDPECCGGTTYYYELTEPNKELVLRAVNSYDAMREALEVLLAEFKPNGMGYASARMTPIGTIQAAQAALALAEKGA